MPNQLFMAIQHIECGFNEKNNNFSLKVNNSKTIEKRCNIYNFMQQPFRFKSKVSIMYV